jgi:hypothetical protein
MDWCSWIWPASAGIFRRSVPIVARSSGVPCLDAVRDRFPGY